MFLNHLKNFFTKKIVKKSLLNVKLTDAGDKIKTVGIVFDETYFFDREALVSELVNHGILQKDIQVLVFKNTIGKNERFNYSVFSNKDLSWTATFSKSDVRDFVSRRFDLLINYYDSEKSALLLVSNLSKAHFKVGFASIDKKLNHFMIDTHVENYRIFVAEMFKYLRILNKI